MSSDPFPTEFVKGASELLLLATLRTGNQHGYALIQALRERSNGRLRMNEGAVYPLLHRLERERKISVTEQAIGRRIRKTYSIRAAGKRALAQGLEQLRAFHAFVEEVCEDPQENDS